MVLIVIKFSFYIYKKKKIDYMETFGINVIDIDHVNRGVRLVYMDTFYFSFGLFS